MPTIHYLSNNDLSEVDMHTGLSASLFLFRFIDKTSLDVKQITAATIEQARTFLGGDLVFAARFRQDDNYRATRSVTCHR